jgi:hypothetical protein
MVLLGILAFFQFVVMPFAGGLRFLFCGINFLLNYDPEYDEKGKKYSAMLDILLGTVLLAFFHGVFWMILLPGFQMTFNLNLPTFSWPF